MSVDPLPPADPALDPLAGLYASDPDPIDADDLPDTSGGLDPTAPPTLGPAEIAALRNTTPVLPGEVVLERVLMDALRIEPQVLTEEFARIPYDYARWNEVHAELSDRYLTAKNRVPRVRAQRSLYFRRFRDMISRSNNGMNMTETTIAELVTVDPQVIAAEDDLAAAERDLKRVRGILTALTLKSHALASLGAHVRSEMAFTDPNTRGPAGHTPSRRGR